MNGHQSVHVTRVARAQPGPAGGWWRSTDPGNLPRHAPRPGPATASFGTGAPATNGTLPQRPRGLLCSAPAGQGGTALCELITGLGLAGRRTGVCRLNASGRGASAAELTRAGAVAVLDFVDAGCAPTGALPLALLERSCSILLQAMAARGVDLVLFEADGGLAQPEVSALLMSQWFRSRLAAVLLAQDHDAPGREWLDRFGLTVLTDTSACLRQPLR